MDSIGSILQNERIKRGISLAEAHEATKITIQNLTALEEDRFDSFPNRVYARAFLRDYANYLRLDSAELLDRYEAEWGPKSRMEPVRKRSRFPAAAAAVVIVLVAALAVGAYYFDKQDKPSVSVSAPSPEPVKTTVKPKAKPEEPKAEEPQTAEIAVPPVPAPVTELKLQMTATSGSWVRVKPDDQSPTEFTLGPGQIKTFTAKDKFTVRLGRPNGVELHLNGQRLPMLGTPGVAVTREIDRSWLKPAPAAGVPAGGTAQETVPDSGNAENSLNTE